MQAYIALLRAVNVGGTGKLPMAALVAMGRELGFQAVRTHIASGNLLFRDGRDEDAVKTVLAARLRIHAGQPVGVLVRTAAEMAQVARDNPFPDMPGERVGVLFLDQPAMPSLLAAASGLAANEEIRLGRRELYIHYGDGMGRSKLRIPAAASGTVRNMNTVVRLAELSSS